MSFVIDEIFNEIKFNCSDEVYNHLKSFITVKLNGYKITKEENSLVKYEESESERLIKMFLVSKKIQGLSDRTITAYKNEIFKAIGIINKSIADISHNDIKYYLACMQLKGTVSNVTIDNTRRFLSSFFQYLEDEELIRKNPIKNIKKIKQQEVVKKAFKYDEIEKLKLSCEGKREIALVEFILSTGVRASELANIKLEDVNFKDNEVKVLGKGNKERLVYLNSSSKIRVLDYIKDRKGESKYLFCNEISPYNKMQPDQLRVILKRIGKRARIKDTHPHKFRRTCATIAHKRGMQIEEIQKMLGHSSISTTQIYVQVDNEEVKKSHQKYMN